MKIKKCLYCLLVHRIARRESNPFAAKRTRNKDKKIRLSGFIREKKSRKVILKKKKGFAYFLSQRDAIPRHARILINIPKPYVLPKSKKIFWKN